ncbi:TetR/AcrR family transcriptional regulator [Hominimerdicola sp. 21CYCFAH17_S]
MARNKYPEITEQRILDSAYKLFVERGWEKTTIQDIIDDLGDLTRGAFYHHFNSKEDIIDAVTDRMFANENPFERVKRDSSLSGKDMLKNVLTLFLTNEESIKLVKKIPASVRESPQLISKQIKDCKTIVAPYIQNLIEIGNEDGSLQIEHPKQVAEMFSYLITIWVSPKYSLSADEYEADFVNTIDTFSEVLTSAGLPILDGDVKDSIIAAFKKEY